MVSILYEDEDILAVDKPEGLASVPERGGAGADLITGLMTRRDQRLWVVHRLDKEVSGVILFAKNAQAHRWLNAQFAARRVEKHYVALVHGHLVLGRGTVEAPIRAYGSGRMGVDPERGKASCTHYERMQVGPNTSLVTARPVTGRRHQIRVHLYHIGHAIVGDRRYGDPAQQATYARLMLHARRITFSTREEKTLALDAPLPPSFLAGLSELGIAFCDA